MANTFAAIDITAHVPRYGPGIGIVASARRKAHDYTNGLALVKLLTQSCTRSTDTKAKPKHEFNQA
jgi:hypothetical protein